jgi:hypothetical protein
MLLTNDERTNAMSLTYFAADGSYGDATGMFVVDTSDWADDDWDMIEHARDNERPGIAQGIARGAEPDAQLTLFDH